MEPVIDEHSILLYSEKSMTGFCCTSSEDRADFSQPLPEIERYHFTSKEMDEETGLYYMSARYQNPVTSRWVSSDPAGFGLVNPNREGFSIVESMNPYSYCGNNPIRYSDPTGLYTDEEITNQQKLDEQQNSSVFIADPDASIEVDPIQMAVDDNLGSKGGTYEAGNMCDDWSKETLDNGFVNTEGLFAGDPNDKTVDQHIANAQSNDLGEADPKEGWSLVFLGDSKKDYDSHAGLMKMNSDGTLSFFDSSKTNPGKMPDEEKFTNMSEFKKPSQYGHYKTMVFIPVKSKKE